jgi:hypothetical protein
MDQPFIILNSGTVALLDDKQLAYVMGHEVGHIMSDHVLYRTMTVLLLNLATMGFPIVGLAARAVLVGLLEWYRKSELSSDRAGLVGQIREGPDPDALDCYGQTALMIAATKRPPGGSSGPDSGRCRPRSGGQVRLVATMLAVVNHRQAVAEVLAEAGADLTRRGTGAPGFAGRTASDLARERGFAASRTPDTAGSRASADASAEWLPRKAIPPTFRAEPGRVATCLDGVVASYPDPDARGHPNEHPSFRRRLPVGLYEWGQRQLQGGGFALRE